MSVCLRVTGSPSDAEDAAQAVFPTLAQKAEMLRGRASLGGWLYHVARLISLNARKGKDKDQLMKELLKNRASLLIRRDPKGALTFMAQNLKGDGFSKSRLGLLRYLQSTEDMAK